MGGAEPGRHTILLIARLVSCAIGGPFGVQVEALWVLGDAPEQFKSRYV